MPVTEATLVDEIERDRDAVAPYLVYADWLLQRGDPRGALIVLQEELARTVDVGRQAELRAHERELLDTHLTAWMGGEVRGPRIKLTWRRGFLDELYLDYREADFGGLARLVRSPLSRFVRSIDLRTHVVEGLPEVLGAPGLRHLETLGLGSYRWHQYTTRGIAARFPALQELNCDADSIELADLRFGSLRSLSVGLNGWRLANIEALAAAELPRLESLLVWGGRMLDARRQDRDGDDDGDDDDDEDKRRWFPAAACRRLLDAAAFPALRQVSFTACDFGDELIEALAGSALLRQVSELILDDDAVTEDGYGHMVARADAFRHLTRLQLRDSSVPARSKARLDAALGPVIHWD